MNKKTAFIAALGTAQTLGYGTTYYLPAILANNMAAELGLGTAWIFVAFSAGLLAAAALGPVTGRLIDAQGGRRVLCGSSLVFAAGLALLGAANGPVMLFAAWLVIGAGMAAGLYESAFATLARIYGDHARGAITGITLIAGFASTICWPISAWLDVTYGWRVTCFVWAASHLVIGLPLNLLIPGGRYVQTPGTESSEPLDSRANTGAMLGLAYVFAATWFCSTAMAAHLPRLLQEAGASLTAAIAAAALVGPAQVAGRILEFALVRRVSPVVSARVATLAHPAGAAVLGFWGAPSASAFTLLHGGGNGIMTIAMGTLPLHLFGPGGYGLRQGLLVIPARVAQAFAPFVFDLLLTRFGLASLLLTAALGVTSFLVLTAIPARKG